mmetsp:Transcript_34856/g.108417  ORF Transcript_34856/g.108417 Transcript_34856/m.108417 type:complete len:84 (-) Transcript_34856:901-1152(-)
MGDTARTPAPRETVRRPGDAVRLLGAIAGPPAVSGEAAGERARDPDELVGTSKWLLEARGGGAAAADDAVLRWCAAASGDWSP